MFEKFRSKHTQVQNGAKRESLLQSVIRVSQNALIKPNPLIFKCQQLFNEYKVLSNKDDAKLEFVDCKKQNKVYQKLYSNQKFSGAFDNVTQGAYGQICGLIPNFDDSLQTEASRLVINLKPNPNDSNKDIVTISEGHPLVDPLSYPLLFPYATPGWNYWWTKKVSGKWRSVIKPCKFYRFRLQEYVNHSNCHMHCGRLTQQYAITAWNKTEQDRLNYFRTEAHRKSFIRARGEDLEKLLDGSTASERYEITELGKRTILPNSFTGSPRYMRAQYQDAMALCAQYGKPSLFITFTCNGNWPEIQKLLKPGETFNDRFDICNRVFYHKVKELIKDIKQKQIFGKCRAYTFTIEFQKRGLPHCHLLVILDKHCMPKKATQYDKFVSAEIPDIKKHPILHSRVVKFMVHSDCEKNPSKYECRNNSTRSCCKGFPKPFQPYTIQTDASYPVYRRRSPEDGGFTYVKKGTSATSRTISNQNIVPYNPFLIMRYNAHINVEICATVKAYKYIYKYITVNVEMV